MKRYIVVIMSLVLFITYFNYGCSTNGYDKFDKEFSTAYLVVADSIDIEDIYNSVKSLQSSTNKKEIGKMKTLLAGIKLDVPKKQEKHFEMLNKWYEGIVFLRDAYRKWEVLTEEEKSGIQREVLMIDMRKDELKS